MKWYEKLKLGTARILLGMSDKLLARDPSSFGKFLSQKAKEQQEERFVELKEFINKNSIDKILNPNTEIPNHIQWQADQLLQTVNETPTKNIEDKIEELLLKHRDIDFDFSNPEEKSDELIIFHGELEALIFKHITTTSGLVIAGPLVAEALKLYRTILPQEEYDHIISHIYQTRNSVQPTILPEDIASKTVY